MDPASHLNYVKRILDFKSIARVMFVLATIYFVRPYLSLPAFLSTGLGYIMTAAVFLFKWFVILFTFYLFYVLIVNKRRGWAITLVIMMGLGYSPLLLWPDINTMAFLGSILPLFFLVFFCIFLNIAMRDWNLESREEMLIRRNVEKDDSRTLRNR